VFIHPLWHQSPTGAYARTRAELREAWREKKAQQRAGDVPVLSPGQVGDTPGTSLGTSDINQSINGKTAQTPPLPPRGGGEPEGLRRWEWLLAHHERPLNPERCVRYLQVMPAEDWALCQWIFGDRAKAAPYTSLGKKRAIRQDTHKFLASQGYLQFRREWVDKLKPSKPVSPLKTHADVVDQLANDNKRRLETARGFLLELLADPDASSAAKDKARAVWEKAHPEDPTPWLAQVEQRKAD